MRSYGALLPTEDNYRLLCEIAARIEDPVSARRTLEMAVDLVEDWKRNDVLQRAGDEGRAEGSGVGEQPGPDGYPPLVAL